MSNIQVILPTKQQEELKKMYQWVQPQIAIPTHGEAEHLQANAEIARLSHVPRSLTGLNGDLFKLAPEVKVIKQAVKAGRIALQIPGNVESVNCTVQQ